MGKASDLILLSVNIILLSSLVKTGCEVGGTENGDNKSEGVTIGNCFCVTVELVLVVYDKVRLSSSALASLSSVSSKAFDISNCLELKKLDML